MKRIFISLFLILILFISCFGCTPTPANDKLVVYSSFYPMYDLTNRIGKDKIKLVNLVPFGTEPHDWEPSPTDVAGLSEADLFVYNGAGMESFLQRLLDSIENPNLIKIEACEGIDLIETGKPGEHSYDPHVWLNPLNAKTEMYNITEALCKADPDNQDFYRANYAENALLFDKLDKDYSDTISAFTSNHIIVAHESFGYICEKYGIVQIGIMGLTAETEPDPQKLAQLIEYAKQYKAKYIFFEESASPKLAEVIARETGAETAILSPLEGLSQRQQETGADYVSVMYENLMWLKKALQ